jgi:Na+/proline symporter
MIPTVSGMQWIDVVVMVAYLLGVTALGAWTVRKVRGLNDFLMPRRFGVAMMIMHAFGTGTSSDQAVSVASATFRLGVSGIWYQWMWLFATPFYWVIAPIMRRFRAVTTADVLRLRYDQSIAVLFALVGMVNMALKIGVLLKGSGALIDACTGGTIPSNLALGLITVLFIVYGTAGGLAAAIATDFVQGIMTIAFSVMLLPPLLGAVGGMAGIRAGVSDPAMLSLVAPGEIGAFYIAMFALQALVGIIAQPFVMGVCAAGKTELEGRIGFMVGNLVKRLCTVAWCLTALGAVAYYARVGLGPRQIAPDLVYGDLARHFLPEIMPGLLGVFVAALLGGVMSACGSVMIASSGLFTENLYKPWRPGLSNRHYLVVARFTMVLVVASGLAFAFWLPDVVVGLKIWFKVAPIMGIAFWLGLLWRRTNVAGAWAAAVAALVTWWLATRAFVVQSAQGWELAAPLRLVWHRSGAGAEIYEPWQIALYLTAGTLAGIVVSLLTRPVDREKLDRFYALTRTPIVPGEVVNEPCTLPAGVEPVQRPMLATAFGLELPRPSPTSLAGFVAGWAAVAVLIGSFYLLLRI